MIKLKIVVNEDKEKKISFDTTVNCNQKEFFGYTDYLKFMLYGAHPQEGGLAVAKILQNNGITEKEGEEIEMALLSLMKDRTNNKAMNIMYHVILNANIIVTGLNEPDSRAPAAPHISAGDIHELPPDAPDTLDESIREANYKPDIGGSDSGDWCHNDDKGVTG